MKKNHNRVETRELPEVHKLARVTAGGEIPDADSELAVAGIFKLKQHVDNPGQTPM
jgi:hypothetical protein